MTIWVSKNITLDVPAGSTINELMEAFLDIKQEYGNLKLPSRFSIALSNHTSQEIEQHYNCLEVRSNEKENSI